MTSKSESKGVEGQAKTAATDYVCNPHLGVALQSLRRCMCSFSTHTYCSNYVPNVIYA
jgi:hypothetical protein